MSTDATAAENPHEHVETRQYDHTYTRIRDVMYNRPMDQNQAEQWLTECDAMVDALDDAVTPLRRRDLEWVAEISRNQAQSRLRYLRDRGEVKVVEPCDGVDGRSTYYTLTDDPTDWVLGKPRFSALAKADIHW